MGVTAARLADCLARKRGRLRDVLQLATSLQVMGHGRCGRLHAPCVSLSEVQLLGFWPKLPKPQKLYLRQGYLTRGSPYNTNRGVRGNGPTARDPPQASDAPWSARMRNTTLANLVGITAGWSAADAPARADQHAALPEVAASTPTYSEFSMLEFYRDGYDRDASTRPPPRRGG